MFYWTLLDLPLLIIGLEEGIGQGTKYVRWTILCLEQAHACLVYECIHAKEPCL